MTRIKICKEPDCNDAATTAGYCRLHYLKNWKQIKNEERKKAAKRLNKYVESVVKKHPDRYVDVIKEDLRSPRFEKQIETAFGNDDESDNIFDEPNYDEEVRELIEKLKKDSI